MAKAFKVKATRNGYRRAGHSFSSTEEKTLLASDLTKEQIEQLQNDANLVVVETDAAAKK